MRKGRTIRLAALSAVTASLAVSGALVPASPAAARPADCSLHVRISPDPGSMYARAEVNCPQKEHYAISIVIRREDPIGNRNVAENYKGRHQQGYDYLSTSEPCSDVQTNRKYHAHGYLYDTRFGPPIEVKDVKTRSVSGHC